VPLGELASLHACSRRGDIEAFCVPHVPHDCIIGRWEANWCAVTALRPRYETRGRGLARELSRAAGLNVLMSVVPRRLLLCLCIMLFRLGGFARLRLALVHTRICFTLIGCVPYPSRQHPSSRPARPQDHKTFRKRVSGCLLAQTGSLSLWPT
jgi:hypothetical protein